MEEELEVERKTYSFFHCVSHSSDDGKVLDDSLSVDRLPCSRLPSEEKENGLMAAVGKLGLRRGGGSNEV